MNNNGIDLSGFMDVDGKIIISDNMPDDLKEAITFLNDNNINLFTKIEDYEIDDLNKDDLDEDELDEDDLDEDDLDEDDLDEDDLDEDDLDDEGLGSASSNVDDLNNLF